MFWGILVGKLVNYSHISLGDLPLFGSNFQQTKSLVMVDENGMPGENNTYNRPMERKRTNVLTLGSVLSGFQT